MKIGYTCQKEHQQELLARCDEVILSDISQQTGKGFYTFIKQHIQHEIHIMNHLDLGLQLNQLLPSLEYLDHHNQYIRTVNKNFEGNISDPMYQKLLLNLAKWEKAVMSNRMKQEHRNAKELGLKQAGRPSLNSQKVAEIREMYHRQHKTLKQVAEDCQVSIGTAYKYAIQQKE